MNLADALIEIEKLREEIRKLKACPICHRDFIENEFHSNCGDITGPSQNQAYVAPPPEPLT
jgi:hypothetical protein